MFGYLGRGTDGSNIKWDWDGYEINESTEGLKYVKLFEQFINEGLKPGKDTDLANTIIKVLYAERGTAEGSAIGKLGGRETLPGGKADEQKYLSGFDKDSVKALASGKVRVPGKFMMGELITAAADNGKSYYFDGGFVEGDVSIPGTKAGMPFRDFIDALVKHGAIEAPKY